MPSSNRKSQRSFINSVAIDADGENVETEFVAQLKHVESPRCEAFRFPVVSLEDLGIGSRQLPREQSQKAERLFRIA